MVVIGDEGTNRGKKGDWMQRDFGCVHIYIYIHIENSRVEVKWTRSVAASVSSETRITADVC